MPMSEFYRDIRSHVGSRLLLMPAVAAVIHDAVGRILCQQQHNGAWSLPAGAVEPSETPASAVVREVLEETGLYVRPVRILAVLGGTGCRVQYPNGDEVEYTVTVFECEVVAGALIQGNDETQALAYCQPDALPAFNFPYPPQVFEQGRNAAYFELP